MPIVKVRGYAVNPQTDQVTFKVGIKSAASTAEVTRFVDGMTLAFSVPGSE